MNARKHAAKALYKAPPGNFPRTRYVTLRIPDNDAWFLNLYASLVSLTTWLNYERSNTTRESEVAQIWRDVLSDIKLSDANVYTGLTLMPIGSVVIWFSDTIPEGWLPCDGSSYDVEEFPDLALVLGASYIIGDVFQTPNMSGQVPIGVNPTTGDENELPVVGLGEFIGEAKHKLTQAELPVTNPRITAWQQSADSNLPGTARGLSTATNNIYRISPNSGATTLESRAPFGGDLYHNNVQPSRGVWYIIKALPDEITGIPGENGALTMLRQNPENPYLLEQSFNGGLDYSLAFNYELIKPPKCNKGGTSIEITTTITTTSVYITNITNQYDGDVLNVYPDAVYDGGSDDLLRDLTLCWTLRRLALLLQDILVDIATDYEQPPTLEELLQSGAEAVGAAIAAFTGVFAAANTGNPVLTVLTAFVLGEEFNEQLRQFEETWEEFNNDPIEFENVDVDTILCCLFSQLQGVTITESGWIAAFHFCATPEPSDDDFTSAFKLLFRAMGTDDGIFAAWLDLLQIGFTAQKAGIVFDDCPCITDCDVFPFDVDGALGWTSTSGLGVIVPGDGWKSSDPTNVVLRINYDTGALRVFQRIELVWQCPRNDDAQYYRIEASVDNSSWTELKYDDYQPVGKQREIWTGTFFGRYVRLTVVGSFDVSAPGWIYEAMYCSIPL